MNFNLAWLARIEGNKTKTNPPNRVYCYPQDRIRRFILFFLLPFFFTHKLCSILIFWLLPFGWSCPLTHNLKVGQFHISLTTVFEHQQSALSLSLFKCVPVPISTIPNSNVLKFLRVKTLFLRRVAPSSRWRSDVTHWWIRPNFIHHLPLCVWEGNGDVCLLDFWPSLSKLSISTPDLVSFQHGKMRHVSFCLRSNDLLNSNSSCPPSLVQPCSFHYFTFLSPLSSLSTFSCFSPLYLSTLPHLFSPLSK